MVINRPQKIKNEKCGGRLIVAPTDMVKLGIVKLDK